MKSTQGWELAFLIQKMHRTTSQGGLKHRGTGNFSPRSSRTAAFAWSIVSLRLGMSFAGLGSDCGSASLPAPMPLRWENHKLTRPKQKKNPAASGA